MSELSEKPSPEAGAQFLTTRWTMVLRAGCDPSPEGRQALEDLCRVYWYPLYCFVRRRGYSKEDAEDLVQGFFLQLLDRQDLENVTAERGKFRAFLLAALKHFLANEWDRAGRQKRGGHLDLLSLDWAQADARYGFALADESSPDRIFDRSWAVVLLDRVLEKLRAEMTSAGKVALFAQFKPFLSVGKGVIPYEQVAAALDLSEAAARVAVHRLRRRYRELLRDEVAETLDLPGDVEEEMRALQLAFG